MRSRRTFSRTAVVMLAGAALIPAAAFARGGGFAHGGHGPVFGFHHAPVITHRPLQPAGVQRFHGRFVGWWRLHRFGRQNGDNSSGVAGSGYGGSYYPYGSYNTGDATGTLPPPAVFAPPTAPASEHIGCLSRGYDVPRESGGLAHVTVTRC